MAKQGLPMPGINPLGMAPQSRFLANWAMGHPMQTQPEKPARRIARAMMGRNNRDGGRHDGGRGGMTGGGFQGGGGYRGGGPAPMGGSPRSSGSFGH